MTLKISTLTPTFSVSSQVAVDDIPQLLATGVKTLMCNRPDGETPGQPTIAELRARAEAAGIRVHHLPVIPGAITASDVAAFTAALEQDAGPVHAFCRTGTRSITLWALNERNRGVAVDELLRKADSAGYDLRQALGATR